MQFEKYKLSDALCKDMQERMKYLQGGDCFFIRIIRDKNNAQILYNAPEFPQKYKELEKKLRLYRIYQYKNSSKISDKDEKEMLCFVLPRQLPLRFSWQNPPIPPEKHTNLCMDWLDKTK